jgi:predicted RNase H-like HicB family nuclease
MKQAVYVNLDIEKLPEGYYVATSPDVQGLVAQGKTFEEVVDIAQDIARILLRTKGVGSRKQGERIFYPMRVTV